MRRESIVEVTRAGNDTIKIEIEDGVTSLTEVLSKAGLSLSSTETVSLGGETVDAADFDRAKLEDGDIVQVFGKKEGGLK